ILWICVFATGLVVSAYLSFIIYYRWETSPVIISVGNLAYPVEEADFPAVSVCNSNKVSKAGFQKFLEEIKGKDDAHILKSLFRGLTTFQRRNEEDTKMMEMTSQKYNISMDVFIQKMMVLAPSCKDMIQFCTWQKKIIDCRKYFILRPSDEGLCCVFNGASLLQRLRNNSNVSPFVPLRTSGGTYLGLTILLDAKLDDYLIPSSYFSGFKMLVHDPREFPEPGYSGFAVEPGTETFVGLKLTVIKNGDMVHRNIKLAARNCYFRTEKKLKYFVNYTTADCLIDCRISRMVDACGCRPWIWFVIGPWPVCNITQYQCLIQAEFGHQNNIKSCDCQTSCEQTRYDLEISQVSFPGHMAEEYSPSFQERFIVNDDYVRKNLAMVHVFYKERTGTLYIRDIRYGWEDIVASIGGLLGLGVGFSFISAIEVLYFLLIRWWSFVCR
ncbi:hypothetical protein QYM36_006566, partial [Artemia franciscana]